MSNYAIVILLFIATGLFLIPHTGSESDPSNEIVYYTDSGTVIFTSRVPLHTFTGESNRLTGMIDPSGQTVDFFLDLASLKTGISRRDRDMYRTLDVDTYPFAEFTGNLDTPFSTDATEVQPVNVSGDFKIHGISRQVQITGTLTRSGDNFLLEAAWEIDIQEYNIEPPGILFYRVNDIQEVQIEAELKPVDKHELMEGS